MNDMSERIKKLMADNGFTAYSLADAVDVFPQTVRDWKAGRTTPRRRHIEQMADIFGVGVDWIINGDADA